MSYVMKLPGVERAFVDESKLLNYLLSPEHPIGRSKARFFNSIGFRHETWPELQQALLDLVRTADAIPGGENAFGQKYIIRGIIKGPTGMTAAVETVWIVLTGEETPRFVTAYPGNLP